VHLRAIYDKHGEFGLKEGIIDAKGVRHGGGYFMSRNADAIFDQVYTSKDPWAETRDLDGGDLRGSMFGDGFRGQGKAACDSSKDIEVTVECTLAEFYMGCLKTVSYCATQVQHDARSTKQVERTHQVQIHPGYGEKTVLKFACKGNEVIGADATNLVIKFK
jgi:DnaJ-class molecular chaperone